jgi:hypothetical protein
MNTKLLIAACSAAIFGLMTLSSGAAFAQQKTAKECNDEWTAQKATLQAAGKKKKDFITECRGGTPATPAASTPGSTPAATTPAPTAKPVATRPAKPATTKPAAENEFTSEALAKSHCPGDTVVWVNLASKIYHYADTSDYGRTKKGAYMCEKDTAASGFRAAKNEKKS